MRGSVKVLVIGMLIGILLFAFDVSLRVLSDVGLPPFSILWQEVALYILYSVPLSFVNSYFFDYVNEKINWGSKHKTRLTFGFFGSVLLTIFTLFIVRILHRVVIDGLSFTSFFESETLQFYFIALIITLVISLFFHAFYFYKMLQEKRVKEQKIIAGTASAKFESLKNQIDPHFLFNSLNVLTSLIDENPNNAQKFTTSLSKIYRYVLDQKDKELVDVQEELAFAKTYMALLEMRFENSITYEAPKTVQNPEAKVVPLSLQLLLENAIKHNIVSESKPLHIRIFEEDNQLVLENNYQKKDVLQNRKGVGLQNIADRYNIVTDRKISIEQTDAFFRVKLPELTKQITIMETNNFNKENAYFKAKERVKEMKEFYGNLFSYCVVIPFLIFINYFTYWGFQWFWFPLFGWGLGVAIHGFSVFGYGSSCEERKIKELMEKDEESNKNWK